MADVWHHSSDAFSSIGSFLGVLGARMGFPILDPLASIVICLFILKAAFDIFRDAVGKMTDRACDEQTVAEMHEVILTVCLFATPNHIIYMVHFVGQSDTIQLHLSPLITCTYYYQ